jgi:tetratricopeptide (TPR) repeat protein
MRKPLLRLFLLMTLAGLPSVAQACPQRDVSDLTPWSARYQRRDLAGAIAELRKALKLHPHDPGLHFQLGNALYRNGEMRAAADSYRATLSDRPDHFEAHMSRGFALYEVGESRQAVAEWSAAVQLEPKGPFAHAGLAVGLYATGHVEDAKAQYDLADSLDHRYSDLQNLRVDIRWTPKALAVVKRVLELLEDEKNQGR